MAREQILYSEADKGRRAELLFKGVGKGTAIPPPPGDNSPNAKQFELAIFAQYDTAAQFNARNTTSSRCERSSPVELV